MGIIRLNTWDRSRPSPQRPEPPLPAHDAIAEEQAYFVIAGAKHFGASAMDIGLACVARGYSPASKEEIGLALGSELVEQGRCVVTASNRFIMPDARRR